MLSTVAGTDSSDHGALLTRRIIGCAFAVGNEIGCGFYERIYERALVLELRRSGMEVEVQKKIPIYYAGSQVGEFRADIVVENQVLVELKTTVSLGGLHVAQCLNYLRATKLPVCLLMNFAQPKVQVRRIALSSRA